MIKWLKLHSSINSLVKLCLHFFNNFFNIGFWVNLVAAIEK